MALGRVDRSVFRWGGQDFDESYDSGRYEIVVSKSSVAKLSLPGDFFIALRSSFG
jgi:hypothetical protein